MSLRYKHYEYQPLSELNRPPLGASVLLITHDNVDIAATCNGQFFSENLTGETIQSEEVVFWRYIREAEKPPKFTDLIKERKIIELRSHTKSIPYRRFFRPQEFIDFAADLLKFAGIKQALCHHLYVHFADGRKPEPLIDYYDEVKTQEHEEIDG